MENLLPAQRKFSPCAGKKILLAELPFPDDVADEAGEGDGSGEEQRGKGGQATDGFRNEEEVGDNHRHEERRYEGEPIAFVLSGEIDGAYPQGNGCHQLRSPGNVLPHGVEARGVAYLPGQQGDAYGKDGQAQQQT